jgi:alpha-tubulin suppressor-like RCC1 family protein
VHRSSATWVDANKNWVAIEAGNNHMGALKNDGTIWVWGINDSGNLDNNSVVWSSSPVQVSIFGHKPIQISMGRDTTAILAKNLQTSTPTFTQTATPSPTPSPTPTPTPTPT